MIRVPSFARHASLALRKTPWWRHQMKTFSALLALFVWWIHRSSVNSPHKGQWRGALMFSLICAWIIRWVNNSEVGDLRRHRAHYEAYICLGERIDIFNIIISTHKKVLMPESFAHNLQVNKAHGMWIQNHFHYDLWSQCLFDPNICKWKEMLRVLVWFGLLEFDNNPILLFGGNPKGYGKIHELCA